MLKKTITYVDFNGEERTEDLYFNLTKAELTEMELEETGGLSEVINRIIQTKDTPELIKLFKSIILKAYGEKSADGRRFIKSKEISEAFSQTQAYSDMFMEFATDDNAAANFINSVVPKDLAESIDVPVGINTTENK